MNIVIPIHLIDTTLYAEGMKIELNDSISKKDALIAQKYHKDIQVIEDPEPPKRKKSKTQ